MTRQRQFSGINRRPRRISVGLYLLILLIASQTNRVKPNWITQPVGYDVPSAPAAAIALAIPNLPRPNLNGFVPEIRVGSRALLDVVKARGFIGERYLVKSRDGTPLSVYHVINPHANQRTLYRFPVLVLHGVTTDASSMVVDSKFTQARPPTLGQVVIDPVGDTSLALALANNNFDVWLADARGTNLNNHLYAQDLDPAAAQKFWNFSLDEQIHYDLPALIDFVLQQTHSDKLHYIGFSESTFFMFALLSHSPYYQSKLASYVALAPVAYVNNIRGVAVSLFTMASMTPDGINGNLIPQPLSDAMELGVNSLCSTKMAMKAYCMPIASSVSGDGASENSREFLTSLLKGTSVKSIKHFIQLHYQQRLGMFDYGARENMRLYGSVKPPDYNLANIHLPSLVLFRGGHDFLANPEDQQLLLKLLGTKPYRDISLPQFNHLDFLSGKSVAIDINKPAIELMLELAKLNAAQMGARSVFKDPEQANRPGPFKPLAISLPDGSRDVEFKKNLTSNLVNGLVQTKETKRQNLMPMLPGLGGLETVFKQPLASVQQLGAGFKLPNFELPQQKGALAAALPFG